MCLTIYLSGRVISGTFITRRTGIGFWIVLYLFFYILSAFGSQIPFRTSVDSFKLSVMIAVFYATFYYCRDRARIVTLAQVMIFFGGALGYRIIYPDVEWSKLFFMTAITLSTVGYEDVLNVEENAIASYYTMVLMLAGMGIVLYSVSAITAFFLEEKFAHLLRLHSMKRRAGKMEDHYIVCGAGQTGIHAIQELHDTKTPIVVIEQDEKLVQALRTQFHDVIVFLGNAIQDQILKEAGVEKARGLIALLHDDKDNLILVVTAKMLNPHLKIVSKAIELSMVEKLKNAGAAHVVSPNFIGGMRIASEILRPHVVSFLDGMLRRSVVERILEVSILPGSKKVGRSLESLHTFKKIGIHVIAVARSGTQIYNPDPAMMLEANDVLIFIGSPDDAKKLEHLEH